MHSWLTPFLMVLDLFLLSQRVISVGRQRSIRQEILSLKVNFYYGCPMSRKKLKLFSIIYTHGLSQSRHVDI